MNIDIFLVPIEKKHILRNMLEIYLYDMSEYDNVDDRLELNDAGLYGYRYLDYYWNEDGWYPYLVTVNGKLAGFCLVRTDSIIPLTYEIAEFFIMRKYRKSGVGRAMIKEIFSLYKGNWIIDTPIANITAQNFWRKVANSAAIGDVTEAVIENRGMRMQWRFTNSNTASCVKKI